MQNRPRSRRVTVVGARVRFANTVADLVNVSRSGTLIRAGDELRLGGEWPLVLELLAVPVRLTGRVVRRQPAEVSLPGGAALQRQYSLAFKFVNPSAEAQAALDEVCSLAIETGER